MICDICNKNEAIGVASTSIPFSCAMCQECCQQGAEPVIVFHNWYFTVDGDLSKLSQECLNSVSYTKEDGYILFKDWVDKYGKYTLEKYNKELEDYFKKQELNETSY